MRQAVLKEPGVIELADVEPPTCGPGEVLLRQEAVGLNFIDVYHRTGLYPLPSLPATPGLEGAGIVEAIGEGVTEVAVGDRVAYAGPPPGGVCRSQTDAGPPYGQASGGHFDPSGGSHDAARHDSPLSAARLL